MSEWDELSKKFTLLLESFNFAWTSQWLEVKAEGDKLQIENEALHELNHDQFQTLGRMLEIEKENKRLDELEKKHYQYALDANKRLGDCRQKLINIHNGLRELLEYNYLNLCRTDIETLLENNSLGETKNDD